MGKGLYSKHYGGEEDSNSPPEKKVTTGKRKSRKAKSPPQHMPQQPVSNEASVTLFSPGAPAPTENQRRAIRQRQVPLPMQELVQKPMEEDIRRVYETKDGEKTYSEPKHLPPRHDLRKPRHLQDVDLEETSRSASEEGLSIIADMSATDSTLNQVDNLISEATGTLQNLASAAEAMESRIRQEPEMLEELHHAQRIVMIVKEALQPWMAEVDSHFTHVLEGTVEGDLVEGDL